MIGISSFGSYVPLHRLGQETKGWGLQVEKTVGNYDEDSLTMAVAASLNCLGSRERNAVDGLYFASTTAPYKEKLAAATVAIACDLRNEIVTADFANSLRAGTTAIRTAFDTVKAGSAKSLIIAASECGRLGRPRDSFDRNSGDGAAAFLIGDEEVLATLEASWSLSNELLDIWRLDGSKYVNAWEERFVMEEVYAKVFSRAVAGFLEQQSLLPEKIDKIAFYAPDLRRHSQMAKKLGFAPTQVQDPLFGKMGNTGTAFGPMLLVAALEEAKPGDRILTAGFGNGVDVLLFEVTNNILKAEKRSSLRNRLEQKRSIPDYEAYLGLRHNPPEGSYYPPGRPSASVTARDRDAIFRLYAGKCSGCGTVEYPPQRICSRCRAKDSAEPVRLSDRRAKVFTYTLDNLAQVPASALPVVDSIIDFEGGGRGCFQMTDCDPQQVAIGMQVEMTFRKMHTAGAMNTYFWKCTPVRGAGTDGGPK